MKKLALALCLIAAPLLASAAPWNTWAINHAPAAATKPTISQAAVATARHVATSITVCTTGVAAQGPITFTLRNGATGAGTILWQATMSAVVGQSYCLSPVLGEIVGSKNTAMTLEATAAPAATNFATVSLTGYTESVN